MDTLRGLKTRAYQEYIQLPRGTAPDIRLRPSVHAAMELCIRAGAVADNVQRELDGVETSVSTVHLASAARDAAEYVSGNRIGNKTISVSPENADAADRLTTLALGLCGEAAQLTGAVSAALSADDGAITDTDREQIIKEAGDVLRHLSLIVGALGGNLASVPRRD